MSDMPDAEFDAAYSFLKSNTQADLRFDDHIRPIRFVIAPDGSLATPVMVAMQQALDTVLFVPEASDGAMEIMVALTEFDESTPEGGALADRWRIYHGEPDDVRWATLSIDCVRYGDLVFDGLALMMGNALADEEATICRTFNTDRRDDLIALCKSVKDMDIADPVCVGADGWGIDVRATFGIVRVTLDTPVGTAEDLYTSLEGLGTH